MNFLTAMVKATYWYDDALQKGLASHGIASLSRAQSFVIGNIIAGESRASNIAKNLGVSRQAISQVLGELNRMGMIMVEDDPSNRRSRIVKLNPNFEDQSNICMQIFDAIDSELEARIGATRLRQMRAALDADWGEPPQIGQVDGGSPNLTPKSKEKQIDL